MTLEIRNHYIKFYRDTDYFTVFPIPQNREKKANGKYEAANTDPNQKIEDNENYGVLPKLGKGSCIIDFDNKEKYRKFCEQKIKDGFMVIESGKGWHLPVIGLSGNISKMMFYDYKVSDNKSLEIQGPKHYCMGPGSEIYHSELEKKVTYLNKGSEKFFDANGEEYHKFVNELVKEFKLSSPKKSSDHNLKLRKRFLANEPPKAKTSNDYFYQAALQCNTDKLTREEAMKKIEDVYTKWKNTPQFSDRPWSEIENTINGVYDREEIVGGKVVNTFEDMKSEKSILGNCVVDKAKEVDIRSLMDIYVTEQELKFTKDRVKIDNAAKVIKKFYNLVTIRKSGVVLLYNGKIYDAEAAESVIRETTQYLIKDSTKHERAEVLDKIKVTTFTDLQFDEDPNLITVENGILNLETLELSPHTPEHLSQVLLPVEYHKPESDNIEENLKDTLFWKYLTGSFTVEGELREDDRQTVLEIMASPIVKRHVDEKAFMFLGHGDNGKSVCLDYIKSMLGKKNVTRIPLQKLAGDKFMAADLDGISANIFSDLEKNELRHTGEIKNIVSGEGLQVQKKHGHPFVLYPFAKLMFSCNKFPKSFDQEQGFFRRWIIVKWERNFENDPERIEYLRETLESDLELRNKVFSNLVSIARKLNKVGKFTHTKDWKSIQREWNENADPLDDFATNYIEDSEGHKTKRETYNFYKEIMFSKGESPMGMGRFSKAFEEYFEEDRIKDNGFTQRIWLNIKFKRPDQEASTTKRRGLVEFEEVKSDS